MKKKFDFERETVELAVQSREWRELKQALKDSKLNKEERIKVIKHLGVKHPNGRIKRCYSS